MEIKLSSERIESFVGCVIPIKLISCEDVSRDDITWTSDSDAVMIKSFAHDERLGFNHGVFLTLLKAGCATVSCVHNGRTHTLEIVIREMTRASSEDSFNYYIGDMHDHTCPLNYFDEFNARQTSLPHEYIEQVREEGLLDFTMISDHSQPLSVREFFDNFFLADRVKDSLTVFPGCENDLTVMEEDRYGIPIKRSGEIVTINCDDFKESSSWDEFSRAVLNKPYSICILAHPQIVGFSKKGVWDFGLDKNNTPEMLRAVKLIETGDGSNRQSNLINEFAYSMALDNGFKVSTTCSSDSHGPVWGYHRFPGKTVIMARERSYEAFLDAIQNNRVYGCESANLKLRYSVNGVTAPATLPEATTYKFKVTLDYFREDETTRPVKCQVISDKGRIIKTLEGIDFSDFEFEVESDTASYFFLRFVDPKTRRTWSPPVWTGRAPKGTGTGVLTPIDKRGFTAKELKSGECAPELICDDPTVSWESKCNTASILIDMQRTEKVSALGHYPRLIWREFLSDRYGGTPPVLAEFPLEYEISTSTDGKSFTPAMDGMFRKFGSEEIIEFSEREARYVRLDIKSNVATFKGGEEFEGKNIVIGELTVYKK